MLSHPSTKIRLIVPNNITLPNDIPITNNLYAYYDSSSFLNNIWYDLTNNNNHVVNVNGDIKINNNYIYGDNNSSILFPCEILPPVYTIFHICKYNGKNNGSILYGYDNVDSPSWYSGFYKNKSGIASHGGSITQYLIINGYFLLILIILIERMLIIILLIIIIIHMHNLLLIII